MAWYLTRHTDSNCRNAGVYDYALIPVDDVLITWADDIICASAEHLREIQERFQLLLEGKRLYNLDIPDIYPYRAPALIEVIKKKLKEVKYEH